MLYRALVIILLLSLAGCGQLPISSEQRRVHADQLAASAGWKKQQLETAPFQLVAYVPTHRKKHAVLTVYIEGDGLAWLSRSQVSPDPTPQNPTGLKLALKHDASSAVYIARPCQYVEQAHANNCDKNDWTHGRFATGVIQSTQQAIDILMQQFNAEQLQLVGYSGGGAVAALVASQRDDVIRLITVAGNLDHLAWTRGHRVTTLTDSLNPADVWHLLVDIPQLHLVGGKDRIIQKHVAKSYISRFPANKKPVLRLIDEFDHVCCWVQQWPELLNGNNMN